MVRAHWQLVASHNLMASAAHEAKSAPSADHRAHVMGAVWLSSGRAAWGATVRGTYGTPEEDARTQYVQYAGPWGQVALRLRYVQHAGGGYA